MVLFVPPISECSVPRDQYLNLFLLTCAHSAGDLIQFMASITPMYYSSNTTHVLQLQHVCLAFAEPQCFVYLPT